MLTQIYVAILGNSEFNIITQIHITSLKCIYFRLNYYVNLSDNLYIIHVIRYTAIMEYES